MAEPKVTFLGENRKYTERRVKGLKLIKIEFENGKKILVNVESNNLFIRSVEAFKIAPIGPNSILLH